MDRYNLLKTEERHERRERIWADSEKYYIWGGEGQESISSISKVSRQCPLVRRVQVMHMVGINFLYDSGRSAL
jgi:hypothetical protein